MHLLFKIVFIFIYLFIYLFCEILLEHSFSGGLHRTKRKMDKGRRTEEREEYKYEIKRNNPKIR